MSKDFENNTSAFLLSGLSSWAIGMACSAGLDHSVYFGIAGGCIGIIVLKLYQALNAPIGPSTTHCHHYDHFYEDEDDEDDEYEDDEADSD
jgi:hypothetical protein